LDRLTKAHGIPRQSIVGHSDVATTTSTPSKEKCESAKVRDLCRLGRKGGDPGHEFIWENIEKAGFGLIPSGSPDVKTIYGGIFAGNPRAHIDEKSKTKDEKSKTKIIEELQDDLAKIGYSVVTNGSLAGNSGAIAEAAVKMFQSHFFTGERDRESKHTNKKPRDTFDNLNDEFDGVVDMDTAVMIKKVVLGLKP
jgi:N-acetyl-anhydromuramyl-L-alanine amidase AmpD